MRSAEGVWRRGSVTRERGEKTRVWVNGKEESEDALPVGAFCGFFEILHRVGNDPVVVGTDLYRTSISPGVCAESFDLHRIIP